MRQFMNWWSGANRWRPWDDGFALGCEWVGAVVRLSPYWNSSHEEERINSQDGVIWDEVLPYVLKMRLSYVW